jgi:hypothetical protein
LYGAWLSVLAHALNTTFTAHVEVPASLLSPPGVAPASPAATTSSAPAPISLKKDSKKKYHLTTATDPLLAGLRDLNFSAIGKKLNQVARKLDEIQKVISA